MTACLKKELVRWGSNSSSPSGSLLQPPAALEHVIEVSLGFSTRVYFADTHSLNNFSIRTPYFDLGRAGASEGFQVSVFSKIKHTHLTVWAPHCILPQLFISKNYEATGERESPLIQLKLTEQHCYLDFTLLDKKADTFF